MTDTRTQEPAQAGPPFVTDLSMLDQSYTAEYTPPTSGYQRLWRDAIPGGTGYLLLMTPAVSQLNPIAPPNTWFPSPEHPSV